MRLFDNLFLYMSNLVLYRKYRPKTFGEITGQEHVVRTLSNAISSGRLSHAYLFAGPRGTGKTTIARIFAKALNCSDLPNVSAKVEPCNKCDACEDINHGRALDLIEIDAASNRGIDEIRDLKEGIKFAPVKTKYKVFIVDEVHMLTKEAFNALLKTLEEPPAHAIFILATTEAEKLLATILSRVQRFDFRKLTVPEIMARLGTVASCENVRADEDALRLIAVNSDGCLRDAESALEQVIALSGNAVGAKDVKEILGTIDIETAREFVNFLIKNNLAGAFRFLHQLNDGGSDPQEFAKALIGYFRKMTVLKVDSSLGKFIGAELTGEQMLNLQEQIRDVSVNDLSAILKKIVAAEQEMKKSPFPFLHLELAAVDIVEKNK